MDMNNNSVWHAGGTGAPLLVKRAGPPTGIRGRRAIGFVPLRATGHVSRVGKDLVTVVFLPLGDLNGTEWHDRPGESARVHRRAR